jgi:Tfp pilus assembly protein PilE
MKIKIIKMNKGYSLIEILFYIAIFSTLALVIINSLITMTKSFRATTIQADLVQSSSVAERISREIRQAYGINSLSLSDLKLNTKDESGNNKTIRFVLSGSDIQLLENDIFIGNLNTPNIQVTALSFVEITTLKGKAIKMSLSVRSTRDTLGRIENFYDTIVLRGDYGN